MPVQDRPSWILPTMFGVTPKRIASALGESVDEAMARTCSGVSFRALVTESALFSAAVPSHGCAGLQQGGLSQLWQTS